MNTEKLNIDLKGDTLRIGADFHELKDATVSTFKTNELGEFVKFMAEAAAGDAVILCQPSMVVAHPTEQDRYARPLAVCALTLSEPLAKLQALEGEDINLAAFTDFLESFKRFGDSKVLDLLGSVRHFKLKKMVSVESSKEKNGDYSFRVGLESGGNDDFVPPGNLQFTVPVFKHMDETITLNFELIFKVPSAAPPRLEFVMQNFAMDDEVLAKQRSIIEGKITALAPKKLWGESELAIQDDGWKYKPNPEQSAAGSGPALEQKIVNALASNGYVRR